MAQFDEQLADLQAKLSAAMAVIALHPEVAVKVADAIDSVTIDPAKVAEDKAQDDARANALARVAESARAILPGS
jgi:hypothetical protein